MGIIYGQLAGEDLLPPVSRRLVMMSLHLQEKRIAENLIMERLAEMQSAFKEEQHQFWENVKGISKKEADLNEMVSSFSFEAVFVRPKKTSFENSFRSQFWEKWIFFPILGIRVFL